MLAASYARNGPARDVLEMGELPTPEPGVGEVRVRVAASGVNPSDVKSRRGWGPGPLPWPRIIPQSDGAGVIDAVGAGVEEAKVGQRVWTWNAQWKRPFGTAAEYVVLPAAQAVPLPESVSFAHGACLGIPAETAHRAVTIDGSVEGQVLLVAGGAGAVSNYAIQIAKTKGATVLTTVSSPEKAEHAAAAGADHVIDYRRQDVAEQVRSLTGGRGVDRIIEVDLGANLTLIGACLAPGGTVVVYGSAANMQPTLPVLPLLVQGVTLRFFSVYELPAGARATAIADLTDLMTSGRLRHTVAARFSLADIARAHEAVESGRSIGNVVVDIAPEPEA